MPISRAANRPGSTPGAAIALGVLAALWLVFIVAAVVTMWPRETDFGGESGDPTAAMFVTGIGGVGFTVAAGLAAVVQHMPRRQPGGR